MAAGMSGIPGFLGLLGSEGCLISLGLLGFRGK